MKTHRTLAAWPIVVFWISGTGFSQIFPGMPGPPPVNLIIPQARPGIYFPLAEIRVDRVTAEVDISEQVARTSLEIVIANPSFQRQEAELLVPVPPGAVIKGLSMGGMGGEPSARLLDRDEARRIYDQIVAKARDPAILEFAGYNLIRSSVFPIEPHRTQTLTLLYENLLERTGPRIDYFIPRSESLSYRIPWTIRVSIRSKSPISAVYSPSHELEYLHKNSRVVQVEVSDRYNARPGPFRLYYLQETDGRNASVMLYPDPQGDGGYFLMLASVPETPVDQLPDRMRREVTIVIDRSGSMKGEKIEQVREAAKQMIDALMPGEYFNIITYNDMVDSFADHPMAKNLQTTAEAKDFLSKMQARGGTDIHDALLESLRQEPVPGTLPVVIFLTDGLPTIGQTSELAIREMAVKSNQHRRRIFTIGVGLDVNIPLLDRIASSSRARATFVLPTENVRDKITRVFQQLSGPALSEPSIETDGRRNLLFEVLPSPLPDYFDGEQIIILGKYRSNSPVHIRIQGNYSLNMKPVEVDLNPHEASTRHSFVPRLWAGRRIAALIDAIRDMGAYDGTGFPLPANMNDPRFRELRDEIVRLSKEFGILTEYTAFLALESTDFTHYEDIARRSTDKFRERAMNTRSGAGAVNQSMNLDEIRTQSVVKQQNDYIDENLQKVSISNVQQINDNAFFQRSGVWVDSRVIDLDTQNLPVQVIRYGTSEFDKVLDQLIQENRQNIFALQGDILTTIQGKIVRLEQPDEPAHR